MALTTSPVFPRWSETDDGGIAFAAEGIRLKPLERWQSWTYLALAQDEKGDKLAVFEDFALDGPMVYADAEGVVRQQFDKRQESTHEKPGNYHGHAKHIVVESFADLLGNELLDMPGDPSRATVADSLPPIRAVNCYGESGEAPHTFVGTRESNDVIPLYYGVRSCMSRINHNYVTRDIEKAVDAHNVWEGLLGGWLPVIVMTYIVDQDTSWEFVTFADTGRQTEWIQPAWYRYVKLYQGQAVEAHYYDSYLPYPQKDEPEPARFYAALPPLRSYWENQFEAGMTIQSTAEPWVADFCKHSMVNELITRVGAHPHYGMIIRNYGSAEHDGFQDILTASVDCYLEWGQYALVRSYIEYYFDHFVRDNGQLEYRGPEIGQYGRMLTEFAQYYESTGDETLLMRCEKKILAITELLMQRRRDACALQKDSAAYGMLRGRHEADIGFVYGDYLKQDFEQPYFSNSTECWRAFHDLGRAWRLMGERQNSKELKDRGEALTREADQLQADLFASLERSLLKDRGAAFLPPIAGTKAYYYDYPYRSLPDSFDDNRVWCEMMHSGIVPAKYVDGILADARVHNGMRLGIFGNRANAVSFICYGEAYGLIQQDRIREFLLFYYAHILHLQTRGTWSSFECVDIDRDRASFCGYCPPAQMTIPTVTKWMLAFENPTEDELWLCKATPREWLKAGESVSVSDAPTRWGAVSYRLSSEKGRISGELCLPENAARVLLRLRRPDSAAITSVCVNSAAIKPRLIDAETIELPQDARGSFAIEVHYSA